MDNRIRYILLSLVGLLSLINILAGFHFYHALFDILTAILCCIVFEIIRIGCLWSFVLFGKFSRFLTIPMYSFVTLTCMFCAITNFHASILERRSIEQQPLELELKKRIELVKREYGKWMEGKLNSVQNELDKCDKNLAWNPNSNYWQNLKSQYATQKENLLNQRDEFLSFTPKEDKQIWISKNAAWLNLELLPPPSDLSNSNAITTALQELWGVTEYNAQKIVSIIIVITVELGILLLSLLAKGKFGESPKPINHILEVLLSKFDKIQLEKFLTKSSISLEKHGHLPLTRELSLKLREIKNFIESQNFDKGDIHRLVDDFRQKGSQILYI